MVTNSDKLYLIDYLSSAMPFLTDEKEEVKEEVFLNARHENKTCNYRNCACRALVISKYELEKIILKWSIADQKYAGVPKTVGRDYQRVYYAGHDKACLDEKTINEDGCDNDKMPRNQREVPVNSPPLNPADLLEEDNESLMSIREIVTREATTLSNLDTGRGKDKIIRKNEQTVKLNRALVLEWKTRLKDIEDKLKNDPLNFQLNEEARSIRQKLEVNKEQIVLEAEWVFLKGCIEYLEEALKDENDQQIPKLLYDEKLKLLKNEEKNFDLHVNKSNIDKMVNIDFHLKKLKLKAEYLKLEIKNHDQSTESFEKDLRDVLFEIIEIDQKLLQEIESDYQKNPTLKTQNKIKHLTKELVKFRILALQLEKKYLEIEKENIERLLLETVSKEELTSLYEKLLDNSQREYKINNQILDIKISIYSNKVNEYSRSRDNKRYRYEIHKKLISTQCFQEELSLRHEKQINNININFLRKKLNFIEAGSSEYSVNKNEIFKLGQKNQKIIRYQLEVLDFKEKLEVLKIEVEFIEDSENKKNYALILAELSQSFDTMNSFIPQFIDACGRFLDLSTKKHTTEDVLKMMLEAGSFEDKIIYEWFKFDKIYKAHINELRLANTSTEVVT